MKTYMKNPMNTFTTTKSHQSVLRFNIGCVLMVLASTANASLLSIADAPLFVTNAQKANVMVILDNSNSMDENSTGAAVGGASPASKSEISRDAVKDLITTYTGKINMGLMAYQQENVTKRHLHNSPYDASFDPANYDPSFTGSRDSLTKRFRTPNTSNPGAFVYFNVALPFYSGGNLGSAFCHSTTANFDNGAEVYPGGPWDSYGCYTKKTNTVDDATGLSSFWFNSTFSPTDSDLAQNILDFGTFITWDYVGQTWFSNTSPGRGYVHTAISDLDATQAAKLNTKLAVSQFSTNAPTDPNYALQNAGLTPIEGTLLTAKDYFEGGLNAADEGGPESAPPESCGKNFIALMTDGLPSVDASGTVETNPVVSLADTAAAADALTKTSIGIKNGNVETYVIGFALPVGTDPTSLDQIAIAGDTANAYLASDPVALKSAFDSIFSDILAKTGASSSAATNSTSLTSDSKIYQAKFNSADWSGQLLSKQIETTGAITTTLWDTDNNVITSAGRNVITHNRDNGRGIAFTWAAITGLTDTTQRDFLNADAAGTADALGTARVNYLRGDAVSGFRVRSNNALGDIINSSPFYLGGPEAGHAESEMAGYSAFRALYKDRVPMIYAGANDGMLHGFDGLTGVEKIAYIPGQVYKNLSALTDPDYGISLSHRYYADGSPMVADANLGSDATPAWKTVLAGGLNAGGQGYYALDVTIPANLTQANAANIALWEFTDEDDADLGYSFNQPVLNRLTNQSGQIARMADGRWALIVGNGYNNTEADGNVSTTGYASLFILFLDGGIDGTWTINTDYIKIETKVGTTATPNGLATPRPIDIDGDGRVDTVYAGDLLGNMWKFDVSNASISNWAVSYGTVAAPAPLFIANDPFGTAQPITTAPLVTLVPGGDTILGFATGQYLGIGDITSTARQTIYGILDSGVPVPGRPSLVQQSLVSQTIEALYEVRVTTQNPVDYTTKGGWYMDLPETGERVVFNPILRDGRFVFTTLTPNSAVCGSGGTSWLMELDYLTGGRLNVQPFTEVGKVGSNQVSGIRIGNIMTTPTVIADRKNKKELKIANDSSGSMTVISESVQYKSGRLLWREIR